MAEINKYFPKIDMYVLPSRLIEQTLTALRAEGQFRIESLIFWAGEVRGAAATVSHVFIPKGEGVFKHPLQVRVDDRIVAALCGLLDPPRIVLLGQVHTHLGEAFHSATDDRYSLDTPGYLSVVIPNGGRGGAELWRRWAFHECVGDGRFRRLDADEVTRRFRVDPDEKGLVHDVHARGRPSLRSSPRDLCRPVW